MSYKAIVGDKGILVFNAFRDLFKDLYKDEYFKDQMDDRGFVKLDRVGNLFNMGETNLSSEYVSGFFSKVGFDITNLKGIVITKIFKYRDDMSYLYAGGCSILEGEILVPYIPNTLGNYPAVDKVVDDGRCLIGQPSDLFKSALNNINTFHKSSVTPNMFGVHMVDDNLVLSAYTVGHPKVDYVYGDSDEVNALLEKMIVISHRFAFDVKDIYWYVNGSYSKTNAMKNSDGEFTLVIS